MLASAVSILQSYIDVSNDFTCSKYAPGSFFAFGVLASVVVRNVSLKSSIQPARQLTSFQLTSPTDVGFNNTSSIIEQFSNMLRSSPAAGGTSSDPSVFVSVLDQWIGETSEHQQTRHREQAVAMMTSVFPAWWRLFF